MDYRKYIKSNSSGTLMTTSIAWDYIYDMNDKNFYIMRLNDIMEIISEYKK